MGRWRKWPGRDPHWFKTSGELVVEPGKECMHGVISICCELEGKGFKSGVRDLDCLKIKIEDTGGFCDHSTGVWRSEKSFADRCWFDGAEI